MKLDKPLSKEEAKAGDLIPEGIYPFEVIDAIDGISKQKYSPDGTPLPRNEMIQLKLKIFLHDGRERIISDYLLEKMAFKLAHFFECIGKWNKYESGDFSADDCYGMSGEVKIYTQKSKDPQYGDKSSVADYMLSDEQTQAKYERKNSEVKRVSFDDDELPF